MTEQQTPGTQAGRDLLGMFHGKYVERDRVGPAILAIEAEARKLSLVDHALAHIAIEAEAQAASQQEIERLTFDGFAAANRTRCESADGFGHPVSGWSISDWFLATVGEFGEAANVAKKLNRIRDGIPGNTQTEPELRAALADELADAYIYLDLLAQSQGIRLASAIVSKWNRSSVKLGYPVLLPTPTTSENPQ